MIKINVRQPLIVFRWPLINKLFQIRPIRLIRPTRMILICLWVLPVLLCL